MSDLAPYNPYDFANPVTNMSLLADRAAERHEIEYYLDHAARAPRPINIAIIGKRASGKTSLLNFTEAAADRRGFFTVRINLDSDIASNQMSFFFCIIDSLIQKACSSSFFNGVHGHVYDAYLDLVTKNEMPQLKDFCIFQFSVRYAKARHANVMAEVPNNVIKHDLELIRNEIKRPIILLFDECNVILEHKELLQKLRNIFMNLPGFMLAFAGTDELFPLMDEVFSPIIRQFKKINVREFVDRKDTRECISRPLESLPNRDPERYFDFSTGTVNEIHDLTGGRPYEIQLLCHAMFRRVQDGRSRKMVLGIAVLDDVQRELASTQNLSDRPILTAVRTLDPKDTEALGALGGCCKYASFDDMWKLELICNGYARWRTREELYERYQNLIKVGIFNETLSKIVFKGDEFDRIYIKYLTAQRRKPGVMIDDIPPRMRFSLLMSRMTSRGNERSWGGGDGSIESSAIERYVTIGDEKDNLADAPGWVVSLYLVFIDYRDREECRVNIIRIEHPWGISTVVMGPSEKGAAPDLGQWDKLAENLKLVGGTLVDESKTFSALPISKVVGNVKRTKNERFRNTITRALLNRMYDEYLDKNNPTEAYFNARLVVDLGGELSAEDKNNIGYVTLSAGSCEDARKLFAESLQTNSKALVARYNLAMALAKAGDVAGAVKEISRCLEDASKPNAEGHRAACLFAPIVKGGKIELEEVREVGGQLDTLKVAERAKELLVTLLPPPPPSQ